MASIAQLEPFVAFQVYRDTPQPTLQHALRESLITFLTETRVAVSELYLTTRCKDHEYLLEPMACHRLLTVEHVSYAPQVCRPEQRWTPEWPTIAQDSKGWDTHRYPYIANQDDCWRLDTVGEHGLVLWLLGDTRTPRRVCVRYNWTLKRDAACEFPDWIYEEYADAIAAGATAMLQSTPDDGNSSKFAMLRDAAFAQAIATARTRKAAQFTPGTMKLSARSFFGG